MLTSKRCSTEKNPRKKKTAGSIILFLLLTNILLWSCDGVWDSSPIDDQEQPQAPEENGQYSVGRRALFLTDTDRMETYGDGSASSRELMVYLWYPAEENSLGEKGTWLDENILDFIVNILGGDREKLSSLDSDSYPNSPILRQSGKYNVILMSHGDGMLPFSNYSAAEFLASHGYVVAGISHTYNAQFSFFPDGRILQADPRASSSYSESTGTEAYTYEIWLESQNHSLKVSGEFAEDMQFVLDELQKLNEAEFYGMLNTDKAGVFGHSLGGAGSVEALLQDSRIKAGADLDGSIYLDNPENGTSKPIMFLLSPGLADFMQHGTPEVESQLGSLGWEDEQRQSTLIHHFAIKHFAANSPNSCSFAIEDTDHFSFTDMITINDMLPPALQDPTVYSAVMDPDRSTEIVQKYLLNFFNMHLNDQQNTLSDTGEYPEVSEVQF